MELPKNGQPASEIEKVFASLTQAEREAIINGDLVLPGYPPRPGPDLRRPRLDALKVYRVRISLNRSDPEIWREVEMRSDLTLDQVHTIIQSVFDWWDYHLHAFALGGDPLGPGVDRFLCPFDVEEGEWQGTPEEEVRLDETMQEVGDELHYLYDYGDNWDLTLSLVKIRPGDDDAPQAVCTDGRRAAPPEDCGGRRDGESLAEVLPDPAAFDVAQVNAAIVDTNPVMRAYATLLGIPRDQLERVPQRLVEIAERSRLGPEDVPARLARLLAPEAGAPQDLALGLRSITWFIDRAGEKGIPLTAAGYLKPADLREVAAVMPEMGDFLFAIHREIDTHPVLFFREALQRYGILRKSRGHLYATRAAARAQDRPEELWAFLAERIGRPGRRDFETDAQLLLLLFIATGDSPEMGATYEQTAAALRTLGWQAQGGGLRWAARDFTYDVGSILANVGEPVEAPRDRRRWPSLAPALARAALLRGSSG